jgi:hypothetical protein
MSVVDFASASDQTGFDELCRMAAAGLETPAAAASAAASKGEREGHVEDAEEARSLLRVALGSGSDDGDGVPVFDGEAMMEAAFKVEWNRVE